MANIMIVDDSPLIRQSLRTILEQSGHRVVKEAENGNEAVHYYKEADIDLVTMDIEMPVMGGIEALRRIREHDTEALVIMISSIDQRSKVLESIKLGAKHYFVKPFAADKVEEVVQRVLEWRGSV